MSLRIAEQKDPMRWLVCTAEPLSRIPLSIDSSNQEILLTGITASKEMAGKPLLNSAHLSGSMRLISRKSGRCLSCLRLQARVECRGILGNGLQTPPVMIDAALAKGIPCEHMYVDVLVFPISVDSQFVIQCLDAFRSLREKY